MADVPDYATRLRLQHRAIADDYRRCFGDMLNGWFGPSPGDADDRMSVVDLACGDGGFTRLWADVVSPDRGGRVLGYDNDPEFLEAASVMTDRAEYPDVHFDLFDAVNPSETEPIHDLVFCADSFQSIDDHDAVIKTMCKLARPGGVVVISETDNAHDIVVSVPVEVDVRLRSIEVERLDPVKRRGYAFGRHAVAGLRKAGLNDVGYRSFCVDRVAPLDEPTTQWIARHMSDRIDALLLDHDDPVFVHMHPDGAQFVLNDPDTVLTYTKAFAYGRRS